MDSARRQARPVQFDAVLLQTFLKVGEQLGGLANLSRRLLAGQTEGGQSAGGLADVPLDRMQTITAIRNVRHSEILARRQQIFHSAR